MTITVIDANVLAPSVQSFVDYESFLTRIEKTIRHAVQHEIKHEIKPNAVYTQNEAIDVTGMSRSTILRAEERRKLKGRWEGRRRFYLGSDLLQWLNGRDEE